MQRTTVCSQNINILVTSQTMYVRWNNVISSGFGVSNGVRQGGILSPYLFCVYIDDLIYDILYILYILYISYIRSSK